MRVLFIQVDVSELSDEDIEKLQEAMLAPVPAIGNGETEDDDGYTKAEVLATRIAEVDENTGDILEEDLEDPINIH